MYNYRKIEKKWQEKWRELDLYRADDDSDKPKKYILDMFPYPSGAGLHVGHVESYTATDIYSRYLRMRGFNVLHPQGWDAFGLPAENYAIKTGIHPAKTTKKAIKTFKRQINSMGFSYDWSRELNSSEPEYYQWTQWFFLFLYKNGLAYKKKAKVNWCGKCQTVLANEQAENGRCERCESEVIQKDLEQWFFRITDFIEDQKYEGREIKGLLSGLETVDWPESTKVGQRNWIGRSEGAVVKFKIQNSKSQINSKFKIQNSKFFLKVFTTRPDTLFGCTYMVVCPEHEIIKNYELRIENYKEIEKYIIESKKKTDLERTDLAKEKTGVRIKGLVAVNPVNNEEIPIFVADYVLAGYGTGAIMAVPAHDERDFEFAKKFDLPTVCVIDPEKMENFKNYTIEKNGQIELRGNTVVSHDPETETIDDGIKRFLEEVRTGKYCHIGSGRLINSEFLNGLEIKDAKQKMISWLEENNLGKRAVNYKMRDWLVSRQRYWGAPIPIIYCGQCGEVPALEEDLPVKLPEMSDFKPTGESPLKYSKKFHNVKCPRCSAPARRESDTMDTFVCSSWYYMRYADPKNNKEFASRETLKKWLPVDVYLGGAEHTVLHLLYSRFFTKALQKHGLVDFNEPFLKLRHQGIILAPDGNKMSKSKGNVINPDDVIQEYGADVLRIYEMFMGPLEDAKPWNTKGIVGIRRFLDKVWRLNAKIKMQKLKCKMQNAKCEIDNSKYEDKNLENLLHKTIKKVTEDIDNFKFNTAIAQMMIFVNVLESSFAKASEDKGKEIPMDLWEKFLIILSPFAPHLTEELWSSFAEATEDKDEKEKHGQSIFKQTWPEYKKELIKDELVNLVLQVNGKVRERIEVAADISEDEAKKLAIESRKIKKWIEDKEVVKIIFVKGKLVNIVI